MSVYILSHTHIYVYMYVIYTYTILLPIFFSNRTSAGAQLPRRNTAFPRFPGSKAGPLDYILDIYIHHIYIYILLSKKIVIYSTKYIYMCVCIYIYLCMCVYIYIYTLLIIKPTSDAEHENKGGGL